MKGDIDYRRLARRDFLTLKILLCLCAFFLVVGCGNSFQVPDKIKFEIGLDEGEYNEYGYAPYTPKDRRCKKSDLIGAWVNYQDYNSSGYYMVFYEDCKVQLPQCGGFAEVEKNTDPTGNVSFIVDFESLNDKCPDLGVHYCEYGVVSVAGSKRLSWTCDDQEDTQNFYESSQFEE